MLTSVVDIALEAGEIIMQFYRGSLLVKQKAGGSLITEADLKANETIVEKLTSLDPSIPIVSEESKIPPYDERQNWQRFWLVDPLDGTAEFVKGLNEFTVNIALVEKGESVLGVIFAPAKPVLYYSEKEKGAWKREQGRESQRIFSGMENKNGPLVVVESRSHGTSEVEAFLKTLNVKKRISAGSSLKFCLVAEGLADIYPRFGPTMEWDVAAGDCIYRNSAKTGRWPSSFRYNKPDFRNGNFVIGMTLQNQQEKI